MGSFRGAETHTRSVLKAVSWRGLGTLDTFAIEAASDAKTKIFQRRTFAIAPYRSRKP